MDYYDIINYFRLIEIVRYIDKEAADYMKYKAIYLKCFNYDKNLNNCFIFKDTPQGYKYWENIENQVFKLLERVYSMGIRCRIWE